MSITQKHVSATYGPVPSGSRLPAPAAELVGSTLATTMPELTPAAGRVLAQHLHKISRQDPHRGIGDTILDIASDLGVHPSEFYGPDTMEHLVTNNQPVSAFLAEARRVSKDSGPATSRAAAHYAQGGIREDLHNISKRHGKPTLIELEEIRDDLERTADAWAHAKVHPSKTISKALGGRESRSAKGRHYAHIDQLYADRLHHGVETAAERAQAAADIARYGGAHPYGMGKGSDYAHIDQIYADRLHHGVETAAERAQAAADIARYGGGWFDMGKKLIAESREKGKAGIAAAKKKALEKARPYGDLLGRVHGHGNSRVGADYAHIDQIYADRLHHGVETAAERRKAAADIARYGGASLGGAILGGRESRSAKGRHYEDVDYRNAVLKHHGRMTAAEKREVAADRRKYGGRASSLTGIFRR